MRTRTLMIIAFLALPFLGGCLTTSTSVEVRSVEEFPGGGRFLIAAPWLKR